MLNVQKMIASAEACLGWPYVSPGSNNSSGIDCSGLFVKIFRDQGASIYHGSNTIYRKYCSEKGKLTSEAQLQPGMAVFKWNANTPEKFNDGLGDFQHIGLVTSINPLKIIHASTGTMCVTTDTKVGKWAYWGKLKDVDYGSSAQPADEPDDDPATDEPVQEVMIGYVNADKVNFRTGPNTNKSRIEYLNTGDAVEVIGETGSWLKCKALGRVGYIKAEFVSAELVAPSQPIPADDWDEQEQSGDQDDWIDVNLESLKVLISAQNGGKVNIRRGNGSNYSRITSVQSNTVLPYIATATNGWLAVKVSGVVGWVSPDFAQIEGAVG